MTRNLVAACTQEVSTFDPHPSGYEDFAVPRGAALFEHHRAVGSKVGRVLDVDAPGAKIASLRSHGHTRCPRPIFPLDPQASFTPAARLFTRHALPRTRP